MAAYFVECKKYTHSHTVILPYLKCWYSIVKKKVIEIKLKNYVYSTNITWKALN